MEIILKALDILYLIDTVEKIIIFIIIVALGFVIYRVGYVRARNKYKLGKWFEPSN